MNVLVTGGAGYVGAIVVERLLCDGHAVTVMDDLSTGHEDAVPAGARLVRRSLLDPAGLDRVVEGHDAVMHLAALSLVGESMRQPTRYVRTNVAAAANLLDAIAAARVPRLVVSSTAAVYGDPGRVPIEEDDRAEPTNPYGLSKLAVDRMVCFHAPLAGIDAVSLRYFNVAGASAERGERHEPETHLIPLVLEAAAGLRDHVSLFGTDYPTPDGTAIRDYVHVVDLADAHLRALAVDPVPGHRVFNLGSAHGFSVREVIEVAREVTGRPIRVVEEGRRAGDPAVLVASSRRIRAELGWEPVRGSLPTIVEDAWRWTTASQRAA